ncbi:MAG: 50S ribosomal protein L21 [Bacteroidales bacterium]
MYAIVEISGQQFKVENNSKLFVHRLDAEEGKEMKFDKILLVENNGKYKVGKPHVKDAHIKAEILSHQKGEKVLVFKKKRRKGYQKLNGHRQQFTELQVKDIVA